MPVDDSKAASLEADAPQAASPSPWEYDWADLVRRVKEDDPTGMEDLYKVFSRGVRYYLARQLGAQELQDKIHDTFLIVVQAIRRGDLREPDRLLGFVRTVVRRQVAAHIEQAVHSRREHVDLEDGHIVLDSRGNPEEEFLSKESAAVMARVLRSVSDRDREILTRFYLQQQSQEQICAEMNLTETQYRLLKSRAKARFGELGRKSVSRSGPLAFLLRNRLR